MPVLLFCPPTARNRLYDPRLGRFLERDPKSDPNNPNPYAFVANNPVNNFDPMGQALIVADESRANYLAKEFAKYGFELDDMRWVNVTDRNGGDHNGFRLSLLVMPGQLPSLMANIREPYWRDMAERALATAKDYVVRGGEYSEVTMKADASGAEAFILGAKEGARAVGNALVDTVVGFVTLGMVDDLQCFGEAKGPGTGVAYALARVGGEILLGVVTGSIISKAGKLSKVQNVAMKAVAKLDKANDFTNTARDMADKAAAFASGDPKQIAMALAELAVDKFGGKAMDAAAANKLKNKTPDVEVNTNAHAVSHAAPDTPRPLHAEGDVKDVGRTDCGQQRPDGTVGCFVAGTQVVTKDGLKPIETMQAGDLVLSRDPVSGRQEYKRVLKAFSRTVPMLVHVHYRVNTSRRETRTPGAATRSAGSSSSDDGGGTADDDGAGGGLQQLITTDEHPFWLEARGVWCKAERLSAGDVLRLADGSTATITQVRFELPPAAALDTGFTVYNFTVKDFHTYFVVPEGASCATINASVFVHNNKTCGDAFEGSGPAGTHLQPDGVPPNAPAMNAATPGQTGSYTNTHESGMQYHGKGPESRADASGARIAEQHNDPLVNTDWAPSANEREAFKDEARRMSPGPDPNKNYNQRTSPGVRFLKEDGQ